MALLVGMTACLGIWSYFHNDTLGEILLFCVAAERTISSARLCAATGCSNKASLL